MKLIIASFNAWKMYYIYPPVIFPKNVTFNPQFYLKPINRVDFCDIEFFIRQNPNSYFIQKLDSR